MPLSARTPGTALPVPAAPNALIAAGTSLNATCRHGVGTGGEVGPAPAPDHEPTAPAV